MDLRAAALPMDYSCVSIPFPQGRAMSFSARERAMIRQYERAMEQLRTSVSQAVMCEGDVPPLSWWEDEATRQLSLQCQAMRRQLPVDYKPQTSTVTV